MLKLIFLSAFRGLLKYKSITVINLLGLVLGITSFLFIQHYLLFEFSSDGFFPKPGNVYRVNLEIEKAGERIYNGAKTSRGLYDALKKDIPEVEANGISYFEKCFLKYEKASFANQDVLWVDEGFEKVFPMEMVAGKADYSRPRAGIVSQTMAKALFGNENPIGKIVGINQGMPMEVTGVFKDLPSNSHLNAQVFATIKTWVEMGAISTAGSWRDDSWWNYVRLKKGASAELVAEKINQLSKTHMDFLREDNRKAHFWLQPLSDLHFISGIDGEMGAHTNRTSLYNLIAIALITLIIAWINYANLAMTHSEARSQQIRMRKLIGAANIHLWQQSLAESIILNVSALILSLALYFIFLPAFAGIFSIPIAGAHVPTFYMFVLSAGIITTGILLSSLYHSVALSSIRLIPLARMKKPRGNKNYFVMVQMALSVVFLTSTIVVFKQISFMKNRNIGIELDNVAILTGPASLNADTAKRARFENFKTELLSNSGFVSATYNANVPGQEPGYGFTELENSSKGISPNVMFYENNASNGFIETYQMKLLAGKDFSTERTQNFRKIIINETSMRQLGIGSALEAIGQKIYRKGMSDRPPLEIIGVVADFHNEGLQKPIYPMLWNNAYPREFGYFAVRMKSQNMQQSIATLKAVWNKHYPVDNFVFTFADEQFNQQYQSESRFGKFYLWLTILSIGIAAMGLYGLILFTFERRTKEISVRKVNGARISEVMLLLNKDFLKWVAIAFVIACPVAWYIMNRWLQNFAYKTELSWWIFALSGFLTLLVALFTVSWQSWRAANRNPVEGLRYE
jgi:putative ABC transport system permease protein